MADSYGVPTTNSYGVPHNKQLRSYTKARIYGVDTTVNSYGVPHNKQLWSTPLQTVKSTSVLVANSYRVPTANSTHSKQLRSTPQQLIANSYEVPHNSSQQTATEYPTTAHSKQLQRTLCRNININRIWVGGGGPRGCVQHKFRDCSVLLLQVQQCVCVECASVCVECTSCKGGCSFGTQLEAHIHWYMQGWVFFWYTTRSTHTLVHARVGVILHGTQLGAHIHQYLHVPGWVFFWCTTTSTHKNRKLYCTLVLWGKCHQCCIVSFLTCTIKLCVQ